ncbi:MAG: peptide deformylase [Calditrichaeota bacterium]|nr:MAG: peptide deformylase [Calditrichota bacterium]
MYKIRFAGDPVLRRETRPIEQFDDSLNKMIQNMIVTMHREDGIGLAAPQVGYSLKLCVVDISSIDEKEHPRAFINPEIVDSWGEDTVEEGCLSIPDVRDDVTRPEGIRLVYHDERGNRLEESYDGWMARVLQHEIDHLNGILFVDYLPSFKIQALQQKGLLPQKF